MGLNFKGPLVGGSQSLGKCGLEKGGGTGFDGKFVGKGSGYYTGGGENGFVWAKSGSTGGIRGGDKWPLVSKGCLGLVFSPE